MNINNFRIFSDRIGTAGQPTVEEFETIAAAGYQDVVNLANIGADSPIKNEADIVAGLGMGYYPIPVVWEDPKRSDFDAFLACMRKLRERKVFVHCAANFRVTAFVSLYGMKELEMSEAEADGFVRTVWEPEKYPAWDRFIREIKNSL